MTSDSGRTALVLPVPEAEDVVGAWRERHDPSAAAGIPAHITVLYPFMPYSRVTRAVLSDLTDLFAEQPRLEVVLARSARFPGVLHLQPTPPEPFARLTRTVAATWPDYPPYGGVHDDVVPHLTVADGVGEAVMAEIDGALLSRLPIRATLCHAVLFLESGAAWHRAHTFRLGVGRRTDHPLWGPTPDDPSWGI